jgi:hypothetical protein
MWLSRCGLVVWLLLPPGPAEAQEPAPVWHSLTRLEAAALALLPGEGAGVAEGFAQVEPTLIIEKGPEFSLHLGAPVRVRVWGAEAERGKVRREDWDSRSDWGQWVRGLKLGSDEAPLAVWLGALEGHSLLSGHLVRRYSNRTHPDYHPAGAFLTGTLGPLYVEALASDVLSARLLGAEVALDVGHVLGSQPEQQGRYMLSLSAAHDAGQGETRTLPLTLAHVDATAVVVARPDFEVHLLAGWGTRPGASGAWGAVAGVGMGVEAPSLHLKLRLEARRQHGGFRQGLFGPDYELAHSWVAGPGGVPLARADFPAGYSLHGEAVVGWDAQGYGGLQRHLKLSVGAEAFSWGRFDVDGRVEAQLLGRTVEVAGKGLAVGLGQPGARYLGEVELRWRPWGGGVYVLGVGGTRLSPEKDGTLHPGAFLSVGLGVEHAR